MAGYLVLARKYRSQTFEEVVGQEPISHTLVNAIKTGRVAHAYLFTGTRGVGKTTMARILAKALNCLSAEQATPEPCNQCDACVSIGRGDDVDVVEIDGASNRGIEEIRELRANAIFHPSRCRYKVYYIDEVHMLTREAFNALLKTLEEPPEHVKFIFATTEVEKVPATILSRCQRFDFRNIPTQRIAEHLKTLCEAEDVQAQPDALFRVARAASGSMRDGLSLLDQLLAAGEKVTDDEVIHILGTPGEERTLSIAEAIADGSAADALERLDDMLQSGVGIAALAQGLADTFRNMMVVQAAGEKTDLVELPEAQKQALVAQAKRFSLPSLVQAVGILDSTCRSLRGSSVSRALLEAALVRLAQADKFIDPESLIKRLESLPGGGGAGVKKNAPLNLDAAGSDPRPRASAPALAQPASSGRPARPTPAKRRADPQSQVPAQDDARTEQDQPEQPSPEAQRPLSSAENAEIARDPVVQRVRSLFDGTVMQSLRDPEQAPATGDETQEASEAATEAEDETENEIE